MVKSLEIMAATMEELQRSRMTRSMTTLLKLDPIRSNWQILIGSLIGALVGIYSTKFQVIVLQLASKCQIYVYEGRGGQVEHPN